MLNSGGAADMGTESPKRSPSANRLHQRIKTRPTSRCTSSVAGLLLLAAVGWAQQTVEIKIGWLGPLATSHGSDQLASFLAAVQMINADPLRHVGNSSVRAHAALTFRIHPAASTPMKLCNPPAHHD
jgi:hypothetical protein